MFIQQSFKQFAVLESLRQEEAEVAEEPVIQALIRAITRDWVIDWRWFGEE
jgi:hypothetical protein